MSNQENKIETPKPKENQQKISQKSVMNYLLILFSAAFCLLLLTLLMEQRTNDEIVDTLSDQVEYAQTNHSETVKQRDELRTALTEAEDTIDALEDELIAVTNEKEEKISQLEGDLTIAHNHIAELEMILNGLDLSENMATTD